MKQFSKELGKVSITPKGDWNSSIANEKLDIVYDRRNNQAYIAKQDVPIGVDIDNREYWQPLNVSGYADNNFINLTAENENGTITAYESLEEAVATIFPINRRVGATLSFYNLNSDRLDRQAEFELWQFNSTDLANWENKDYWNNIYYNWNVFAGWYIDADALKNHVETPNVGQYAYVGSNLNDAILYQCRTNGTWTNTGIKVRNYISVVVSGNITIGENGNWFSDGEDTGIPATPAVDEQLDNIIAKHESLSRTVQGIAVTGGASTATNVTYNNDNSKLNAENAQDAIDELQSSKFDKTSILQESGTAVDKVMSQGAIKTELDKKANTSDVDTKFTEEKNRVDTELDKKANAADVDSKFTEEAVRVDAELDKKADKTTMDTELGKKADKTYTDVELNKKFDKESVVKNAGDSDELVMSQKTVTDKLNILDNNKFDKNKVVQESGEAEDKVMSQKAITTAILDETTRAKAAEKTNAETITNEVARLDEKINDKTNEINVAKEEALQTIAENEQSAIANFNSQKVTPEMLSESTKQLIETSGGGTITNLADDEDITSVDNGTGSNVLKFKDKTYNPDNFSGKGYKRLRKNIQKIDLAVTKITVNSTPIKDGEISIIINSINTHISLIKDVHNTSDLVAKTISDTLVSSHTDYNIEVTENIITLTRKHSGEVTSSVFDITDTGVILTIEDSVKSVNRNILTKDMLRYTNTIYEIRYDFDLDGETINYLSDVTLDFTKGGSLNNGTISSGVCIKGITKGTAVYKGNLSYIIHSSYFDEKANTYLNVIIDKLMSFLGNDRFGMNCVLILDRDYKINGTLILPNVISIDGANNTISFTSNISEGIIVKKTTKSTINSSFIKNIAFVGNPTNGYILNLKSTCIIDNICFYQATRFIKCIDYIDNINISNIHCNNRNLGDDINIVLGRGEAHNVQNINDGISIFKYMGQIIMKNIINPYIYLYNCRATLHNIVFETGFIKLYYSRVIFTNVSVSSNLGRSQYSIEINNPEIKQVFDSSFFNFALPTFTKSKLVFINSGAESNSYIFPPKYKDFQDIKSFDDNFSIEGNPYNTFSHAYTDKVDNAVISYSNYGQVVSANKGYSINNAISISTKLANFGYTRSDYYKKLANDYTNYNCDLRKYAFIKAVVLFDENRKIGYETNKQRVISNGIDFSIINIQNAQDGQCIVFYLLDETDRVLKKSRILYCYGNNILFTDYGIGSSPLQDCDNIDSYEKCLNFTCIGDNVICKLDRIPEVGTWKEGDIAEIDNIRYILRNNTWLLDNVYKLETSKRPSLKNNDEGFEYYDTILKKKILWNGTTWVNLDGSSLDIKKSGTTAERPANVEIGFIYKDTTLNKFILWEGSKWVNLDGSELS